MSYDDWKLATPWDDEVSFKIDFDCYKCEYYNESVEVVVGRGADEAEAECQDCGELNYVGIGE
jgi:hypothetical protein